MKGKLILLASVLLNLLVTCTYGESASSVKVDQSSGNLTAGDALLGEKSEKKVKKFTCKFTSCNLHSECIFFIRPFKQLLIFTHTGTKNNFVTKSRTKSCVTIEYR